MASQAVKESEQKDMVLALNPTTLLLLLLGIVLAYLALRFIMQDEM